MTSRLLNFRSTATVRRLSTASAATITKHKPKNLYRKLDELKIKPDSATNIREAIDEWANEEKLKRSDLLDQINICRIRKHYHIALQLSEWLESSELDMNDVDRALRIDLLAKTRDIQSAEMYFNSLQESAKTTKTYGSLLNCYSKEKLLDKALELWHKIKELGYTSTLNYSNMAALYLRANQPEQVPLLVQEMEQNMLKPNIYIYNLLVNSYAAQKDLDAVEKVLEDMAQKDLKCDWFTYANLATIHINAGMHPKAAGFICKMEAEKVRAREKFHTLINLYKELSDLPGVNRTWEALKSVFPIPNKTSYLVMILALSKLGDLESLLKCFDEWESVHSKYDLKVTNVVLEAYLQRDMIGEANALYESIVAKGNKPNLRTMELLTCYHIENCQIDLALKYLEMGSAKVNREQDKWFPTDKTIQKFLAYFEARNDAVGVEKFCDIMKKMDRLDSAVYESLLSSQGAAQVAGR
ncbi:OLC1v1002049C1 [Oldenlandia corymbosa var. corymbosa]|uniref:OLC1v1002049C1 n=1 Tax=Oldenlandia corymbosa var. corymbosa TaxID=529605 RepID=A0AAV1D7X0_OLDCO|nr:OLC1v1002049C1 [Oldenlandia corymbosa var. corymbosa]